MKILNADNNKEIYKLGKKVRNKRRYKYVFRSVVALILCLIVSATGIYAISGRNIWEIFFHNSGSDYAKEILDYNGQSVKIDDYMITLEQTLYDSRTSIGYCVFAITKEGGKPEWQENVSSECFGEDNRFSTEVFSSGGRSCEHEFIGDTLYEYVSFSVDLEYDSTVNLIDYKQSDRNTIDGFKRYKFMIKYSRKYNEYTISEYIKLAISPLGIAIDSNNAIGNMCISLHYKNGKEETVVDTEKKIGIGGSHTCSHDDIRRYQFIFKEIKNIDEIDYIVYNGKQYK